MIVFFAKMLSSDGAYQKVPAKFFLNDYI